MPLIALTIVAIAGLVPAAPIPITIVAPPVVMAGSTLCFDVIYVGTGSVAITAEINKVELELVGDPTGQPFTRTLCCRVPAGASGSTITITVVSSSGAVTTATVLVL